MQVSDLFRFKNREIKALHLTWIAFFICFYVWFNMAPLASSMLKTVGWLTKDDVINTRPWGKAKKLMKSR